MLCQESPHTGAAEQEVARRGGGEEQEAARRGGGEEQEVALLLLLRGAGRSERRQPESRSSRSTSRRKRPPPRAYRAGLRPQRAYASEQVTVSSSTPQNGPAILRDSTAAYGSWNATKTRTSATMSFSRVPVPQRAGDRGVARHHDGEGRAEDADHGAAGEGFEPLASRRAAVRLAVVPRDLGVERLGEAEERRHEPHGGGGRLPDRREAPAQPERGVRPGHRRVAVHADAGQQQEAAVRVDGVAGARGAVEGAGGGGASAQGDGGLQRQREEQQEVGQRQVQQEDVGHGARPRAAADGEGGDHQAVPRHAEQEHQAEGGELEGLDGELLIARLAVVRLPAAAEVCGVAGVPRVDGEVGAVVVRVADVVPEAELHRRRKSTETFQ
ncbi:hypothetical protein EYF80_036086 [Liparis tanakae]|uniref:Uncharacterized protein n=1 Tax=Liparis tanakae TaxID=230148 RepID=A0A4Z2GKB2_9TELE|nr:hypothetical protein EYF80_036086 [Liparis tanakae]